jgi:flagellar biosynthesis/type III secretory pathway protein FliH
VVRRPELESRAFVIRAPAPPDGYAAVFTAGELERMREEAALGAEERARAEFTELGRGLEEQSRSAAEALFAAVRELQDARRQVLEGAASEVIELALAVARRVLRREVESDPEAAIPVVRELLQRAAAGTQVTVRLSRRDHGILLGLGDIPEAAGLDGIHFRMDPAITPGGVLVETPAGGLDGTIDTQLDRIEEALRARHEEAA